MEKVSCVQTTSLLVEARRSFTTFGSRFTLLPLGLTRRLQSLKIAM